MLGSGLQVDVRLLEKKSFGAALLYFTGSKEHNVALRGRANDMGWTLNEYALTTLKGGRTVAGKTEEEIYAKLKLAYIEPELREMTGEIEAAENGTLPHLVTLADIRGDLQMHTTASDGRNSIEEMGEAARDLGYEYIALTDHSQAVTVANGMDEKRTLEQIKKIRAADERVPGIKLLAGIEVDIKKDGTLDLEDEVLAELDVVVASVHSYMNLERAEMTDRILAAIENPYTQIIAHPTGRLVLRRDPFVYDMEKVLDAAAAHGVAMECNAYPDRLDLSRRSSAHGQAARVQNRDLDRFAHHESSGLHEVWSRHGAPRLDRKERRDQHAAAREVPGRPASQAARRQGTRSGETQIRLTRHASPAIMAKTCQNRFFKGRLSPR